MHIFSPVQTNVYFEIAKSFKPVKEFRQAGIYTSNVVYQEVLRED